MSKDLSQIVEELFANPSEGKELSSQIQRLGEEIRKVIHGDDSLFGKFRGLLESFREVIPEEQQRYHAALKALVTTSKLDPKEIMKVFSGQLEELKIVEKGIMPYLSGWSGGLLDMEARSQQLKKEIASLRERLAQLESEEKGVQSGIAERAKDLKSAEKTIKGLFTDIGAEITAVNKKIGELTGEGPTEQPSPEKAPVKSGVPGRKKDGGDQKVEIKVTQAQDTKFQRKCPMCGGLFNLHELENMWQCYTCGHEEPASEAFTTTGEPANEPAPPPEPASPQPESFVEPLASMVNERQPATQKKPCPACRKSMFWYPKVKAWRCPSCQYERRI